MSTGQINGTTRSTDDIQIVETYSEQRSMTGRIRGGAVLGGAVVGLGTLLLLELILMTAGLSGATVTAEGQTGGSFVWDAVAGIVAFLVAGMVAGAAVPHRDVSTGTLNAITTWATILIGMLVLTGAVGTSVFGALGDVLNSQQGAIANAANNVAVTPEAADAFKSATGWAAISFAVTLAAAIIGGMIGSKAKPTTDTTATRR